MTLRQGAIEPLRDSVAPLTIEAVTHDGACDPMARNDGKRLKLPNSFAEIENTEAVDATLSAPLEEQDAQPSVLSPIPGYVRAAVHVSTPLTLKVIQDNVVLLSADTADGTLGFALFDDAARDLHQKLSLLLEDLPNGQPN